MATRWQFETIPPGSARLYTEPMGGCCVNDTLLNEKTYHYLLKEASERLLVRDH